MKTILIFFVFLFPLVRAAGQQKLPDEIALAFVKSIEYFPRGDGLATDDPKFIEYIKKNWRWIASNIEVLPPLDCNDGPAIAFNVSVIRFSETCQKLPPLEYIDFLDQMLALYEQKRISENTFESMIDEGLEKQDFLSVNYAHPRVAAILKKAITLSSVDDETLRSCLEDMANGKLADNYMTSRGDNDPPPETLPGIKLKRPWGSLLKKYARISGQKLLPDPDFPEEDQTRPVKHPGAPVVVGASGATGAVADAGKMSSGKWLMVALASLALAAATFKIIRQKALAKR